MAKFACCVVLFEPKQYMINNIKDYFHSFDRVYIVDNSRKKQNLSILEGFFDRYTYVFNQNKGGLSHALNIACDLAIKDGQQYMVTFDQDSFCSRKSLEIMKRTIMEKKQAIAVAPTIVPYFNDLPDMKNDQIVSKKLRRISFSITSGCMFSLNTYQSCGGFDERLFVEHIDTDFCLKLEKNHIPLYRCIDALLYQRAGNSVEKRFLWKKIHPLFSNPTRGYYLHRNQWYLYKRYGIRKTLSHTAPLIYSLVKTIFYEDQKLLRIRYYLRGFGAFILNNYGEIR